MADTVIKVDRVYKDFVLPHEKTGSVKGVFTSMFRKATSKKEVQHALKDISFEIKKGEFFGIVGRNGSGKSTLLKILASIYQPTNGSIQTRGKLVPFIELGVGFNPELTGRDNVYLNGAMLGFSSKEVDAMYKEIVEFAELERFMDQKLKNYSSGMQVRLAFSMAVRSQADILLIDEVLAVGDADFQRKCFDYFKKLKKDKKTVVFVSHDMSAIKEFCDRAALIEQNELKLTGSATTVADEYAQLFLKDDGRETTLNKLDVSKHKGTGAVRIKNVALNKGVLTDKDTHLDITVELEAFNATSLLMSGFAIKNSEGQFINGSHTWKLKDDLALKPGDKCEIVWTCSNIYEDGLYTVDVNAYGGDHEIQDSIEDAISFRVKRPHRSGCLVVLPIEVAIDGSAKRTV